MLVTFVKLFVLSFFIGLSIGCIGSLCLKKLKAYNIGRENECTLICLFAYLSYILTEQLEISPIIVLLFNDIFNSNYSFYNLSFQAREESSVLSIFIEDWGLGPIPNFKTIFIILKKYLIIS